MVRTIFLLYLYIKNMLTIKQYIDELKSPFNVEDTKVAVITMDPETGEIFTIDSKAGEALSVNAYQGK